MEMPEQGDVPDEVVQDLVETSRRLALRKIEGQKATHCAGMWDWIVEAEMEAHEKRVRQITLWAHQKRTGLPF